MRILSDVSECQKNHFYQKIFIFLFTQSWEFSDSNVVTVRPQNISYFITDKTNLHLAAVPPQNTWQNVAYGPSVKSAVVPKSDNSDQVVVSALSNLQYSQVFLLFCPHATGTYSSSAMDMKSWSFELQFLWSAAPQRQVVDLVPCWRDTLTLTFKWGCSATDSLQSNTCVLCCSGTDVCARCH